MLPPVPMMTHSLPDSRPAVPGLSSLATAMNRGAVAGVRILESLVVNVCLVLGHPYAE
jgi:hypothetical protein